jgi:hypothetical protein
MFFDVSTWSYSTIIKTMWPCEQSAMPITNGPWSNYHQSDDDYRLSVWQSNLPHCIATLLFSQTSRSATVGYMVNVGSFDDSVREGSLLTCGCLLHPFPGPLWRVCTCVCVCDHVWQCYFTADWSSPAPSPHTSWLIRKDTKVWGQTASQQGMFWLAFGLGSGGWGSQDLTDGPHLPHCSFVCSNCLLHLPNRSSFLISLHLFKFHQCFILQHSSCSGMQSTDLLGVIDLTFYCNCGIGCFDTFSGSQ